MALGPWGGHTQKVGPETRDLWWGLRPETRNPSCRGDPRLETRDPKGGTRDSTHRWDPGPKTRDPKGGIKGPGPRTLLLHGTFDQRPRTLKEGYRTHTISETQDPKQTFLAKLGTQEL